MILSNLFWKFAERCLAQIITLVVSIVLARILLPEEYGLIALVTIIISFLDVFVTSGLPTALIQKKEADDTDFSSVFYFNLFFSIVLYFVAYFLAPSLGKFYSNDKLILVTRVMALRVIIASLNSVQHAYVSKNMLFKKYFWSTLFGTILSGIIGVVLAYNNAGVWALVAQYMTNTIVDTIVLWITIKWRPTRAFSLQRLVSLVSYGWKILFEALSETASNQLRNMIIGKVYSENDLAYYSKAQQFPDLVINNICVSISSVLFPAMSNSKNNKDVLNLLRFSTKMSMYIIFPVMTGLAIVSRPVIIVLLSDKWVECVPYMRIFCFSQAITAGIITRHQALKSIGKSDVYLIEHLIYRVIFIFIVICVYKKSVMAIAISCILGQLILYIIVTYTSYKFNGYKVSDQIKDIIPAIVGCVFMTVPLLFIQRLIDNNFILIILQVIAGIVIYILFSKIFKLNEFNIILSYLKKIKTSKNSI